MAKVMICILIVQAWQVFNEVQFIIVVVLGWGGVRKKAGSRVGSAGTVEP